MDIGKEIKEIIKEAVIRDVKRGTHDKEKIDNIIKFLQRGWKYEEMWEELEEITGATEWEMVDLKKIKQEYFPN